MSVKEFDNRGGKEGRTRPEWTEHEHPRLRDGRFRRILARLQAEVDKAPEGRKKKAALIKLNRTRAAIESEAINDKIVEDMTEDLLRSISRYEFEVGDASLPKGLREVYGQLGAYMYSQSLKLGSPEDKYKFSELPDTLQGFLEKLLTEVEKGGLSEEGEQSVSKIRGFLAGGDVLSQPEISAELSRLLRFLI